MDLTCPTCGYFRQSPSLHNPGFFLSIDPRIMTSPKKRVTAAYEVVYQALAGTVSDPLPRHPTEENDF